MNVRITMNKVASYTNPTILETDKKTTLIYGLNGCGKSTISNYLMDAEDIRYAGCTAEGLREVRTYVYNNRFVKENFHEMDKLKGIFTLSKANKEIDEKLSEFKEELRQEYKQKESLSNSIASLTKDLQESKERSEEITWKIKTTYSGGDRVLEYCLDKLKIKTRLFDYLCQLPIDTDKKYRATDELKKEAETLQDANAQQHESIPLLSTTGSAIEKIPCFASPVLGNQDSPISGLIEKLGNADWVSQGIPWIQKLHEENNDACPFCQSPTINESLRATIKAYFDGAFAESISTLKEASDSYSKFAEGFPELTTLIDHPFFKSKKDQFQALYVNIQSTLSGNLQVIEKKINSPSISATLSDSSELIAQANDIIELVNADIRSHNQKIENKKNSLDEIKAEFWSICRKDYDQTIAAFNQTSLEAQNKLQKENESLDATQEKIKKLLEQSATLQKQTINVDAAINEINAKLSGLGIDSFSIIKHEESAYRLSRNGVAAEDFHNLSEGEKTIITFLYFIELCKEKITAEDTTDRKIVVIDDPISSLSHIYIFNVGQMIKKELFASDQFEKVILLTHSLYFFYELTDINHERRKETQKLLRIVKNSGGSKVLDMTYQEIQNDYQSYWRIVTDSEQPPVLIANCMRNIIEYFFAFVKKHEYNNVFNNSKLADTKHQAFNRFMNRESHSLAQNIFDIKEFDYTLFQEAFKLLFVESGYPEHYEAMTKEVRRA